jgi:hypothetical protein
MDEEELIENAEAYAAAHGHTIGRQLGFGIHGTVFELIYESNSAAAVKIHSSFDPYSRERDSYERLMAAHVQNIRGFKVPQLIQWDDELLALEMTIVKAPYVLDFAGAFLDFPPEFADEVWADWNRKNQEQFGDDWPEAQVILAELEEFGIYMLDPSPSNIRFR